MERFKNIKWIMKPEDKNYHEETKQKLGCIQFTLFIIVLIILYDLIFN
jgi:hypothetical protein